jgi:hypothetical protein
MHGFMAVRLIILDLINRLVYLILDNFPCAYFDPFSLTNFIAHGLSPPDKILGLPQNCSNGGDRNQEEADITDASNLTRLLAIHFHPGAIKC